MRFVCYSTAAQVFDAESARERLVQFNDCLLKPLSSVEIKGVISSVESVQNVRGGAGYYILGARKIVEYHGLTQEEMGATGFFASKRMAERLKAKRKTKVKRDARNGRFATMKHASLSIGVSRNGQPMSLSAH